jgi:hypothetical protein
VRSLLEILEAGGALDREVDRMLPRLPTDCRKLWKRLRDEA